MLCQARARARQVVPCHAAEKTYVIGEVYSCAETSKIFSILIHLSLTRKSGPLRFSSSARSAALPSLRRPMKKPLWLRLTRWLPLRTDYCIRFRLPRRRRTGKKKPQRRKPEQRYDLERKTRTWSRTSAPGSIAPNSTLSLGRCPARQQLIAGPYFLPRCTATCRRAFCARYLRNVRDPEEAFHPCRNA